MKNFILKFKFFYRLYQQLIRKNQDDYKFIKHVFNQNEKVNILDLCCGDSFILNYINDDVLNYTGIDNNENYLKDSRLKYPKFKFINSDLENIDKIPDLEKNSVDFIFLNGAIHHLDDNLVIKLFNGLEQKYPNAKYLTIDPIKDNNKFLNKIMINFDRGKFIRDNVGYKNIMKKFNFLITDDFFRMSFKLIFHYKNFDLKEAYKSWKK
tara:strand:- start:3488 stop:4114 length:627 start_codon:yes stop_codon:yes gene_type:complete